MELAPLVLDYVTVEKSHNPAFWHLVEKHYPDCSPIPILPPFGSCHSGITRVNNMIKLTKGNLLKSDAEALVNTVNCVGYMGKGIALRFKKAFPENFAAYQKACRQNQVIPGQMFVFEYDEMLNHKTIINFPTKRHWQHNSRMEDVVSGLAALIEEVQSRGIRSIAIPPLGCGLEGQISRQSRQAVS